MQNVFLQYLTWQFLEVPREILKAWKNFLLFNLNYFSIILLLKTLFSPWRKYQWIYPRGFDIAKYLEIFLSNLISRILGSAVRSVLISFGLLAQIFIIFAGIIIFVGWLFLPLFLIFSIYHGFRILL